MFAEIQQANKRLKQVAHCTPVLQSQYLNDKLSAEILFKCENFQRVGAFKFRGAFNAMSQLNDSQKQQGVIAYSSGNHAQAVACVGKLLDIETHIVMPNNAPKVKLQATREYGANVIEFDPNKTTREEIAEEFLKQKQAQGKILTLIPPFNHPHIIAGQGTAAYEFLQQENPIDLMLAPCGGGGLLSGTAIATKGLSSNTQVIGIEPELANDAVLSFKTGILHQNPNPPTIADGTRTTQLGDLTFEFIKQYVDDMKEVSEEAIMQAVQFFFYRMKIVVEPSGALGLAALLSGVVKPQGRVGVIISGGNIDADTMNKILEAKTQF